MKDDFPSAGHPQLENYRKMHQHSDRGYYSLRAVCGRHPTIMRNFVIALLVICLLVLFDYGWSYALYR